MPQQILYSKEWATRYNPTCGEGGNTADLCDRFQARDIGSNFLSYGEDFRTMMLEDGRHCPFCALKADRVVFENELALAIADGFPVSPGHMLILTRRHLGSFFESSEEERMSLLSLLWRAQAHLDEHYRPDGYNVGINDGTPAGQTIPHLHIHLIPRYRGDQHDPRGGVRWVIPEKADYWAEK
ncbi:HIT family protein [Methylotetracoccus oryzae]|uniref:HIT family protein n=1 Tax=Methylotetracoccus oryzae TaxID=1919059 RepID=UPI002E26896F